MLPLWAVLCATPPTRILLSLVDLLTRPDRCSGFSCLRAVRPYGLYFVRFVARLEIVEYRQLRDVHHCAGSTARLCGCATVTG
jgi:hypothetical protein